MKMKFFIAAMALVTILGGCSAQTQQQVEDASKAVVSDVKDEAEKAVDATKEAAAAAEITGKVKAALVASSNIDSTGINVDTVGSTVSLKGTVPSEDQKATAEEIAKNTAPPEATIQNELTIGAADTVTATPEADGTPVSALTPSADGTPVADGTPAVEPGHEGHDHPPGEGHDH